MSIEQEIEARINDFFHSMDTQNLEMMQQLIPKSETTVHVGTDTGEIWKGWQVLNDATIEQFENLEYYKADIRDLTINVAESGTVAWYFHLLDAEIKSGDSITRWEGARFTGVFEKQGDHWVMAQTHVSIPESSH